MSSMALTGLNATPKPFADVRAASTSRVYQHLSLKNTAVATDQVLFGHSQSTEPEKAGKYRTVWGVVMGTLFGGLGQDLKAMLGFEPSQSGQSDVRAADVNPLQNKVTLLGNVVNGEKVAQACMDVATPKGELKHVHHQVFPVADVMTPSGIAQPFWAVSGQAMDRKDALSQGVLVGANQGVIQVSGKMLGSLAKATGQTMPTLTNASPYQQLNEVCVDFPDGSHVHHGLWRGPDVTVTKAGKELLQPTLLLVGQPMDTPPEGMTLDDAEQMATVQVSSAVFQASSAHNSEEHVHADNHNHA